MLSIINIGLPNQCWIELQYHDKFIFSSRQHATGDTLGAMLILYTKKEVECPTMAVKASIIGNAKGSYVKDDQ